MLTYFFPSCFMPCVAPKCPTEKGYILDDGGKCVCPPGYGVDEDENCLPCPTEKGMMGFKLFVVG